MRRALPLIVPVLCLGWLTAGPQPSTPARPFLARSCYACHNAKLANGQLDMQKLWSAPVEQNRDRWERIHERLMHREMPPPGAPQPKTADREAFSQWLAVEFARLDRNAEPDPGRVTARRLNRHEYNATIRDLAGVDFRPADDFPADDSGYGFDNIGDVLSLSPVLMERYLDAAEKIAARAIVTGDPVKPTSERYKAESLGIAAGPSLEVTHGFRVAATYELRAGLGGIRPETAATPVRVALYLDGREVHSFEVDPRPDQKRSFDVRVPVGAGRHTVRIAFAGDSFDPKSHAPLENGARYLVADSIEVRGPFEQDKAPLPDSHTRLIPCGHRPGQHQPACARRAVSTLARRAFRRPVSAAEVNGLLRVVERAQHEGDSFEHSMRLGLQTVLVSPHFLFRMERDLRGTDKPFPITEHELATRLSYFLWSSMPDDELARLADTRQLRRPGVLAAQVRRMLSDPRAKALAENFAGQWLQTRNLLADHKPDPERFPQFDAALRSAMYEETRLFFEEVVRGNRSILDFIDSDWTYLNERLAKHYGIGGVSGERFQRVALSDPRRGGVLTHASILTVSSYPTRTSPVIRGKWVLENFLNSPPPPPPPDVPSLDEEAVGSKGSTRQVFEQHRKNPVCASCHVRMDPLGFGLENYDAVGAWRTADGKFPIDAAGALPDGRSFGTPAELKKILRQDADAFALALTEKLMIYALGRGVERYDRPAMRAVAQRAAANGYRFQEILLGIVESMPFQMRRAAVAGNRGKGTGGTEGAGS